MTAGHGEARRTTGDWVTAGADPSMPVPAAEALDHVLGVLGSDQPLPPGWGDFPLTRSLPREAGR